MGVRDLDENEHFVWTNIRDSWDPMSAINTENILPLSFILSFFLSLFFIFNFLIE